MQFQDLQAEHQLELFRQIVHHLPVGFVSINSELKICAANKVLAEKTGYTPIELYGEHLNLLVPDLSHERHEKYLKDWFLHPVVKPLHRRRSSLTIVTRDKHQIPVQITVFPIWHWGKLNMIQTGEVKKPLVFGGAAIVFPDNKHE